MGFLQLPMVIFVDDVVGLFRGRWCKFA
jgi:hypothetical protein